MTSEHTESHGLSPTESEAQWADLDDRQVTKRQLIELSEEIYYIVRKQREHRAALADAAEAREKAQPKASHNAVKA